MTLKKKYECSKCIYEIPAFTAHFEPETHNEYKRRREVFLPRHNEKLSLEGILRQKVERDYRQIFEASFTWKQFLYETFVFGKSIVMMVK